MKQFKTKWAYLLLIGKVLQTQHVLGIKYELHVQHGFQARTMLQNLRMQAIRSLSKTNPEIHCRQVHPIWMYLMYVVAEYNVRSCDSQVLCEHIIIYLEALSSISSSTSMKWMATLHI